MVAAYALLKDGSSPDRLRGGAFGTVDKLHSILHHSRVQGIGDISVVILLATLTLLVILWGPTHTHPKQVASESLAHGRAT